MTSAEQLGWGLVLALTVWEATPAQAYARLLMSAAAGILAGLLLVLEGEIVGGVALGLGVGLALPWLSQSHVPARASVAEWLIGAPLVLLGLLVTPLGTALGITLVGLARLIAHPTQAALPLGVMQIGIALAATRHADADPVILALACVPIVGLLVAFAQQRETAA